MTPATTVATRMIDSSAYQVNGTKERVDFPRAVLERIEPHSHRVEQRQVEVRKRRRLVVLDMTSAAHLAGCPACDNDGQVHVIVNVGIAHAAAVEVERI